jgi:signal transduction histidine kinase
LQARGLLPPLAADRKRIVQVFQNLLENALRHSPPGGTVVVLLEPPAPDGSLVRVAIRDAGPGFAAADLPHVFEPFFTRRKGGTGLGLSIVQQIVEQHGGRVEARNDPAGGAEVVVFLPIAPVVG